MTMFFQQLVNGITQGGLYALLAIAYSLVYGVMGLVNFSTGSIYMLGAMSSWLVCKYIIESFWLSVLISFGVGFVVAFVLEKIAFSAIRGATNPFFNLYNRAFAIYHEVAALILVRQLKGCRLFRPRTFAFLRSY